MSLKDFSCTLFILPIGSLEQKTSRSEGNKGTVKKMKIEVFYHCLCSVLFCLVHVVFVGFLGQLFNMPRKV